MIFVTHVHWSLTCTHAFCWGYCKHYLYFVFSTTWCRSSIIPLRQCPDWDSRQPLSRRVGKVVWVWVFSSGNTASLWEYSFLPWPTENHKITNIYLVGYIPTKSGSRCGCLINSNGLLKCDYCDNYQHNYYYGL